MNVRLSRLLWMLLAVATLALGACEKEDLDTLEETVVPTTPGIKRLRSCAGRILEANKATNNSKQLTARGYRLDINLAAKAGRIR